MRAAQIIEPGQIEVGEHADPEPGPRDVLVAVEACGICGTDLHIADGHFAPTPYPIVPGHEFAGRVVEVGSDVRTGIQVGARVAVDPSLFCGYCRACRAGRGNLCANWGATGDTVNGAFAELVTTPAELAYELPDSVSFEQGAMVEPLSCAVHGVRRLAPEAGESVLVTGAGTMGLLLGQLLVRSGAEVTMIDKVPEKLELAERMGVTRTATSLEELDGRRFDAAADATGVADLVEAGLGLLERGGRYLVFGVSPEDARVAMSPFQVYNDEITIVGSMAVLHSFGDALDLIASGAVTTEGMVTHRFDLADYADAIEHVRGGKGVKTQVLPGGVDAG